MLPFRVAVRFKHRLFSELLFKFILLIDSSFIMLQSSIFDIISTISTHNIIIKVIGFIPFPK